MNPKKDYIIDSDAFVFSLNQKKIFKTKNENAIKIDKNKGPVFGYLSFCINIKDNILTNNEHRSNPKSSSYGSNLNLVGKEFFSVNELEVFEVEY